MPRWLERRSIFPWKHIFLIPFPSTIIFLSIPLILALSLSFSASALFHIFPFFLALTVLFHWQLLEFLILKEKTAIQGNHCQKRLFTLPKIGKEHYIIKLWLTVVNYFKLPCAYSFFRLLIIISLTHLNLASNKSEKCQSK